MTTDYDNPPLVTLYVEGYEEQYHCHLCRDDNDGTQHRVDLLVDGGIKVDDPQKLVGKFVECELFPFLELGMKVRMAP